MKSNREIELLVEENVELVKFMIKKYFWYTARKCRELNIYEDLAQEGMIGLYKAAKIFDESKGWKFTTIACRCIYSELHKFQERYIDKKFGNDVSLEKNIGKDGEQEISIPIAFNESGYENLEAKELISSLNKYLNKEEKIIVSLRLEGYSQREIGKVIKLSQAEVSRKTKNIRKKLELLQETGTVSKYAIKTGLVSDRSNQKIEKQTRVKELYEKGLSKKEIAYELGVSHSLVCQYLKIA